MGKALNELLSALSISRRISLQKIREDFEWTMMHSYYANMGGFVLDFTDFLKLPATQSEDPVEGSTDVGDTASHLAPKPPSRQQTWESIQERIDRECANETKPGRTNGLRMKHSVWALDAHQLLECRGIGLINTLPRISTAQLEKLTQEDTFVKILALVQVLSLIIQLISRKVSSLPSSQLEIAALAFAASSAITYMLLWGRPRSVRTMTILKAARLPTMAEVDLIMVNGPSYVWTGRRTQGRIDAELDLVPMPNDASSDISLVWIPDWLFSHRSKHTGIAALIFAAIFGGSLFGNIHCLAWTFHFPTPTETLLWRMSSVMIAALPILSLPVIILWAQFSSQLLNEFEVLRTRTYRFMTGATLIGAFLTPYILARLFLIIEMFRSLFFLPPDAFVSTRSGSFPHWG